MDKEFLEITAPPLARPCSAAGSSHSLVGWPFEAKLLRGISSGERKPQVRGLAYSGGKMRLFGWSRPVVVDLVGLNVPESVPLLADHDNETLSRVGGVRPSVEDGTLVIAGEIRIPNGSGWTILPYPYDVALAGDLTAGGWVCYNHPVSLKGAVCPRNHSVESIHEGSQDLVGVRLGAVRLERGVCGARLVGRGLEGLA